MGGVMNKTETVRVKWELDVEVELGTLDRDVAQRVANEYFQYRIAVGEIDTACTFLVNGRQVDLADKPSPYRVLAEQAEQVLAEFQEIEDSGDRGDFGMASKSSIIALKRLIAEAKGD
ncbi:hypothetical protein uan_020 [Pseudomonas phage UAntarctica]|nr:hypothetical protein uan_020 [Pseudomonas phage UAntarctica]